MQYVSHDVSIIQFNVALISNTMLFFINYRVHWLLLKKKLSFKAFDLFHFFMSFILFSTPEVRAEPILRSRQEKTHC